MSPTRPHAAGHMGRCGQSGVAAMEAALAMIVLATLLLGLISLAQTLKTYYSVKEASGEAARRAIRNPDNAQIQDLVKKLTSNLDLSNVSTKITRNDTNDTITVEVSYEADSILSFLQSSTPAPLGSPVAGGSGGAGGGKTTYSTRTVMPMP